MGWDGACVLGPGTGLAQGYPMGPGQAPGSTGHPQLFTPRRDNGQGNIIGLQDLIQYHIYYIWHFLYIYIYIYMYQTSNIICSIWHIISYLLNINLQTPSFDFFENSAFGSVLLFSEKHDAFLELCVQPRKWRNPITKMSRDVHGPCPRAHMFGSGHGPIK